VIVGIPLLLALMFVDAVGDCVPGDRCHKGFLLYVALPTFVVMLAVSLSVRAIVNHLRRGGS